MVGFGAFCFLRRVKVLAGFLIKRLGFTDLVNTRGKREKGILEEVFYRFLKVSGALTPFKGPGVQRPILFFGKVTQEFEFFGRPILCH